MKKEEEKNLSVFETLSQINVNEHTEKKNGLTYLSWAWAWAEVKKRYPNATYTIYHDSNYRPYILDEESGILCFTSVTIEGETLEMWLPVMDGANKAMRFKPYTYQQWSSYKKCYEEKTVAAATMFDINKTIMRCLVKNLAMFGLGLYIYAGEDLPEDVSEDIPAPQPAPPKKQTTTVNTTAIEEATAKMRACKTMVEVGIIFSSLSKELQGNADIRNVGAELRKTLPPK
jgi:hypothetical protein